MKITQWPIDQLLDLSGQVAIITGYASLESAIEAMRVRVADYLIKPVGRDELYLVIERVLARDIDTPGARERHERWSAQLGRDLAHDRVDDSATREAEKQRPATSRYSTCLTRKQR